MRVFLHVFFASRTCTLYIMGEVYIVACGVMIYKLYVLHDMRINVFIYLACSLDL